MPGYKKDGSDHKRFDPLFHYMRPVIDKHGGIDAFAEKIGVSRQLLSHYMHNRRTIKPEMATLKSTGPFWSSLTY